MKSLSVHHHHHAEEMHVLDLYEPLNVTSRCSYGVVWRAKDKSTGEIVALKGVHGLCLSMVRDMEILASLPPHPCIVRFRELIIDHEDRATAVTEYVHTDLSRFMAEKGRALTLVEVKLMTKQILQGIKYLHEKGVMHRDIKPANILMNSIFDLKICISGVYTPGEVTLWYRAPELLMGGKRYTQAIDIWSVGCIMAEFVLNQVLFQDETELMQFRCIYEQIVWGGGSVLRRKVAAAAACPGRPCLTPHGLDLLQRLLAFEPGKRISAQDALAHTWFKE